MWVLFSKRNVSSAFHLALVIFLMVCSLELLAIYIINRGHFSYTLDDPYIHLAVAEKILKGSYGINLGETGAPCSSILWPFLLIPFSKMEIGCYIPLILNLLAAILTLWVFFQFLLRIISPETIRIGRQATWIGLLSLILISNLVGLVFTGMEHVFQVLLAATVALGLVVMVHEKRQPSVWLLAAIILGPLIRYENLAWSVPVLGYFIWLRYYRISLITGALLFFPMISFSLWLYAHGVGFLPSSLSVKSSVIATQGNWVFIFDNFLLNLSSVTAWGMCCGAGVLYINFRTSLQSQERQLAFVTLVATLLHLFLGGFGWFDRYEIYMWVTMWLMVGYLNREWLIQKLTVNPRRGWLWVGMIVGMLCLPYVRNLMWVPLASNNIYEQQFQMHRFVTDYLKSPVAVNDIGWVAYHNDEYVLDLMGLGSITALQFRNANVGPAWMDELARQHKVKAVLIYVGWFKRNGFIEIPATWKPVGYFSRERKNISSAGNKVTVFVIDPKDMPEVKTSLVSFQKTLPKGVTVEVF